MRSPTTTTWSRRTRALVVSVVVLAGAGVLAAGGFEHTLTYYRTPTEVVRHPPPAGERLRIGGLVAKGSLQRHGVAVSFRLTDGATGITVRSSTTPPQDFRPGKGAVVEGYLTPNGVFRADQVLVRHSNEYHPPTSPR